MSIDRVSISNQGIDRAQASQNTESAKAVGKDRKVQTGTDSIALSSKAAELNRLTQAIETSHSERLDKVRAQLESGTYGVSAQDVATKLIDANRK